MSPISDNQNVWDIAEFWIMHKYQRQGFGTKVIHEIFRQFKGDWQVRVLVDNQIACAFWEQAINQFTKGKFTVSMMEIEEFTWKIYNF